MAYFGDAEQKKQAVHEPHADAKKNYDWFLKIMDRVIWLPASPVAYRIHDYDPGSVFDPQKNHWEATQTIKDLKCVIFTWPKDPRFPADSVKTAYIISFHQNERNNAKALGFREQLCSALNYFGGKGWIAHKNKENNGFSGKAPHGQSESEWSKLFSK